MAADLPCLFLHTAPDRPPSSRIPKLVKAPTQFLAPEQKGDLRRALGKYQQWPRKSEFVWVKLNHPP